MFVHSNLFAMFHASVENELGEQVVSLCASDVAIRGLFWWSKWNQNGLYNVITVNMSRKLKDIFVHLSY